MRITAETMIPISFIAVLCGGVLWLGTMYSDISHANLEITNIRGDISKIKDIESQYLRNIDRRLSNLEGKIDLLIERDKK